MPAMRGMRIGQVRRSGASRVSHRWNQESEHYRGSYVLRLVPLTEEIRRAIVNRNSLALEAAC